MSNADNLKITVNDEYANLVPKQSADEFEALKASLREIGPIYAIVVNTKGIVLDGHHRYQACQELGIRCPYVVMNFNDDPLLEKQFIMETNCNRRHLTKLQRIELAYKMEPLYKELARRRMLAGLKNVASSSVQNCTSDEKGRVIDLCAKAAGVSGSLYNMGKSVLQNGPPEVIQEVQAGRMSIHEAYTRLQEQKSAKDRQQHQHQNKHEKVASWLPKGIKLRHDHFGNIEKEIPDGSVDLLISFPGPGEHSLGQYSELMRLGKRVLKDTGWLAIAPSHEIIHDVIASGIKAGLPLQWMFAASIPDSLRAPFYLRIKSEFQPVVLFKSQVRLDLSKGKEDISDFIPVEKTQSMEQVAAEFFIKNFTPENGVVFDPIMRYGYTALPAIRLKRQFIGSEPRLQLFEYAKTIIGSLIGDVPVVE